VGIEDLFFAFSEGGWPWLAAAFLGNRLSLRLQGRRVFRFYALFWLFGGLSVFLFCGSLALVR